MKKLSIVLYLLLGGLSIAAYAQRGSSTDLPKTPFSSSNQLWPILKTDIKGNFVFTGYSRDTLLGQNQTSGQICLDGQPYGTFIDNSSPTGYRFVCGKYITAIYPEFGWTNCEVQGSGCTVSTPNLPSNP